MCEESPALRSTVRIPERSTFLCPSLIVFFYRPYRDVALMNMASFLFRGDYALDAIMATAMALEVPGSYAQIHMLRGFIFAVNP